MGRSGAVLAFGRGVRLSVKSAVYRTLAENGCAERIDFAETHKTSRYPGEARSLRGPSHHFAATAAKRVGVPP